MKKYFLLIFLILITIFLGREFFNFNNQEFKIFAENDYLLIRSESGTIWGYGNIDSPNAQNLKQNITPYFSREKIRNIYNLKEHKEYLDKNLSLQKISRNLVHLNYKKQTFLFFTKDFNDQDREKLVLSNLSLKTDWHILNKNLILGFLPNPKQGILYISKNNPSKKLKTKSREKNIPLISTKETNGISLNLKENKWQLFTRN
jgi:hypothetical protein